MTRKVLTAPQNNGKACPRLSKHVACNEQKCTYPHPAPVLPAGPIRTNTDGNVLNRDGVVITVNGKPIKVNENGKPITADGQIITVEGQTSETVWDKTQARFD